MSEQPYQQVEQTLNICRPVDLSDWFGRLTRSGWRIVALSVDGQSAYMVAERPLQSAPS